MKSLYPIAIITISLLASSCNDTTSSINPTTPDTDPLVYKNNLKHMGAFRVPRGGVGFSYGGSVIAYNPANNSLFIQGHIQKQKVAEISIPDPKITNDISQLNTAVMLQDFSDITEGNREYIGVDGSKITDNETRIGGMLVSGQKLIGTVYHYYDSGNRAKLSHFTSGLNLSTKGDFQGMFKVGDIKPGFVSGWMSHIPLKWQSKLGGTALTGNGALSVIGRTSSGPSAFSFDPGELGIEPSVTATPLFYYPETHRTLGENYSINPYWNGTTKIAGMVMPENSSSVLFFGYHGLGQYNYGEPEPDPVYADICKLPDACVDGPKGYPICEFPSVCTTGRKGIPYDPTCNVTGSDGCYYDPTNMGAKGPHAYPYAYQVWAYDALDLANVRDGLKEPWDVIPYATWALPFDLKATYIFGGAAAYDSVNNLIYVVQLNADRVGCCERLPLIHVFKVDVNDVPSDTFNIHGKVLLLNGSVTLKNNGGDDLVVTSTDRKSVNSFSFNTPLANGADYHVTVATQPADAGQHCKVFHGSGTIKAHSDVTNIVVYCSNE